MTPQEIGKEMERLGLKFKIDEYKSERSSVYSFTYTLSASKGPLNSSDRDKKICFVTHRGSPFCCGLGELGNWSIHPQDLMRFDRWGEPGKPALKSDDAILVANMFAILVSDNFSLEHTTKFTTLNGLQQKWTNLLNSKGWKSTSVFKNLRYGTNAQLVTMLNYEIDDRTGRVLETLQETYKNLFSGSYIFEDWEGNREVRNGQPAADEEQL